MKMSELLTLSVSELSELKQLRWMEYRSISLAYDTKKKLEEEEE